MKVTGFSFIKNAVTYQYPIAEALRSILPLCDEIIVAVGDSSDNTRDLVASIDSRIKILDTVWDEQLKRDGKVLASETDKAFQAIGTDSDWCIYIQGDEVLHEDGYDAIKTAMHNWKDDPSVDGLLLKYRHFFGSYDYVGAEGGWYRHEIRVLKNDKSIYSYKDAQGFRKGDNKKLHVKPVEAYIHHYGWVQDPKLMKVRFMVKDTIYNAQNMSTENIVVPEDFAFTLVNALNVYTGKHPAVMADRIKNITWTFKYDTSKNRFKFKDRFKNFIEKLTGKRIFTYKNYKLI